MAKGKHSGSSTGRGRGRSGGKKPRAANTHTRRGLLALASDPSSAGDVAREPHIPSTDEGNDEGGSSSVPGSRRLLLSHLIFPLMPLRPRCPDHYPSGDVG